MKLIESLVRKSFDIVFYVFVFVLGVVFLTFTPDFIGMHIINLFCFLILCLLQYGEY